MPPLFGLAILLTIISILLVFLFTSSSLEENHLINILKYWENGVWNEALLVFAYQMVLILVLGHTLVLSHPVQNMLNFLTGFVHNTATAVVWVSLFTLLVSFFNWGLCLIFRAILVRKIGSKAAIEGFSLNYPLLGAAGYVGMMSWHGGMSGSAPLKAAEASHLKSLCSTQKFSEIGEGLPNYITTAETIFSIENLTVFGVLLSGIPLFLWWLSNKRKNLNIQIKAPSIKQDTTTKVVTLQGVESYSRLGVGSGLLMLLGFVFLYGREMKNLQMTLNKLHFFMLGLGIVFHKNLFYLKKALSEAIKGVGCILIQFSLYFGIM